MSRFFTGTKQNMNNNINRKLFALAVAAVMMLGITGIAFASTEIPSGGIHLPGPKTRPTETTAAETVPEETAEETQGERKVFFTSDHSGRTVKPGTVITLQAHVTGMGNTKYIIHWQYTDNGGMTVFEAGTGSTWSYTADAENANRLWRVYVEITEDTSAAESAA